MIKIKTKADLNQLKSCTEVSPAYYQLVEEYFSQLIEELCPEDYDPDLYNLERDGYIVVLTSEDNPHKLAEVGLPNGIANSFPGPEWSEYHELSDGTNVYQIVYMMTNDFFMIYYLDACLWPNDPIMQQFLQDQWAESTFNDIEAGDPDAI